MSEVATDQKKIGLPFSIQKLLPLYFYASIIVIQSKVPLIVILLLFKSITISGTFVLKMSKSAMPLYCYFMLQTTKKLQVMDKSYVRNSPMNVMIF